MNSVNSILVIIEEHLRLFQQFKIPAVIIDQFAHQAVYYIASSIFNTIIQRRELCSPGTSLQVKLAVSEIDRWLAKNNGRFGGVLNGTRSHLEIVFEASNVLMMATNEQVWKQGISEIFHRLNLAQIRTLIDMYTPDK